MARLYGNNADMLAIISDIHSNTEALKAVLDDIARRDVEQIICLGDVVGYGPEPKGCLDMVMDRVSVTLMGNHDYAVMFEPNKFNIGAEAAAFWTRRQIETEVDEDKRNAYWDFLGRLPVKHTIPAGELVMGEMVFVHGSPRRPINEYVFPDDIYSNPGKIQVLLDRFDCMCFIGHTHVPGVILEAPDFYSPEELDGVYNVKPGIKALINVGSVGQPRDRDKRASYVIVEPGAVRFIRVEYDVDSVIEKVSSIPELDDYLGARLKEGR